MQSSHCFSMTEPTISHHFQLHVYPNSTAPALHPCHLAADCTAPVIWMSVVYTVFQKAFWSFPTTSPLPILSLSPAPQHHRLPLAIHPRSSTGPAPCPAQQHSSPFVSVLWEQIGDNLSFHHLKQLARVLKRSL